jgi:putative ABC transport system permease protein
VAQGDVGALGVAASLLLVAVAVLLSLRGGLGLERSLVWASARALVQLLLVGVALAAVIDPDSPIALSWLWVAAMVAFSADVARRRAPWRPSPSRPPGWWRWGPCSGSGSSRWRGAPWCRSRGW